MNRKNVVICPKPLPRVGTTTATWQICHVREETSTGHGDFGSGDSVSLTKEELKRKIESEVTDPVLQEDFMSTAQLLKMEGRQEGRQEGEIRKALKVARNLEGTMPLEEIARIVELPLEELRRLLQDQQE
ncbi:hypothetical protein [Spirochaeta dissipatitropha]